MRNGFLGSTLVLAAFAFSAVLLAQNCQAAGSGDEHAEPVWNLEQGHRAYRCWYF